MSKKPFSETIFGRIVLGKNHAGKIIYSVLDVLPVPNVHEVVKAAVKDKEAAGEIVSISSVLKDAFVRLDWLRTVAAVVAALIVVKGTAWLGIELGQVLEVLKIILGGI